MAEASSGTTTTSSSEPSTSPTSSSSEQSNSSPSPSPSSTTGEGLGDKLKKGATDLAKDAAKGLGNNLDSMQDQVGKKLSGDDSGKKKEERDEDFVKSMMAMLRNLTEEINGFIDDFKKFAKAGLDKAMENDKVKQGLETLKDAFKDLGNLTKSDAPTPSPKGKKGEAEEGVEMTDFSAKSKDADEPQMSSPPSSPGLKEIAKNIVSGLKQVAQGFAESARSSNSKPDSTPEPSPSKENDGPSSDAGSGPSSGPK